MNRAGMDGRKAQAPRMLVILILVAVGIASTLMFQNQLFAKVNEKGPKEICKASVYQYALGSFQGINFVDSVECPTQRIVIYAQDSGGIQAALAEKMYDCYDQFWQGKYELFNGPGVEQFCVICHVIKIEQDVSIPAADFLNYLRTTNSPDGKTKYLDYLMKHTTDEDALSEYKTQTGPGQYDIVTGQPYATVFTYLRKGYMNKMMSTGVGVAAGVVAGGLLTIATGGSGLIILGTVGGVAGGAIGFQSASDVTQKWEGNVLLLPYAPDVIGRLGCTELPVPQKALNQAGSG